MIGFRIYIRTSNTAVYAQEPTYCPDTSTTESTSCTIPIYVLQYAPFSLLDGDSIYAKVLGYNLIGDGAESIAGNGA